jgi:tetratricopeptide (TPR) repeat protein
VFPGALVAVGLGLPVLLVTGYSHRVARRAATQTPTYTPNGSPTMTHGTVAQLALRASPHLSWRRAVRGGAFALGAFVALVAGFMTLRAQGIGPFGSLLAAGAMRPDDVVVVADFASPGDTTLGRAVAQGVKADLAQSSAVRVLDDGRVAEVLRRMRREDDRLPLDVAREVAQRAGAKVVIDGTVAPLGAGFLVSLRLVTADSGHELASERASVDSPGELIAAVGSLTRRLRGRIGESLREVQGSPRLEAVTTASLEALRAYTEAYRATGAGDRERAVALARQAVAIDTGFALAWRHLSEALRNAGYAGPPVDSAIERAYALRGRLTPRERLVVVADYFSPGPGRDRVRAIAAYDSLYAMGDRQNTNSLASRLVTRREFARAESISHERIRVDPEYSLTYANLARAQLLSGRLAAADSTIARASSRFPGWSIQRAYLLAEAQYAHGDLDSAVAILERARDDQQAGTSSTNLAWLADLMAVRGQLARERQLRGEVGAALGSRTPARAVTDTVRAVLGDVWRLGQAPRHVARLDAALASPTFTAPPPRYRPYLSLASAYAFAGSPGRARSVLARYEAEVGDTAQRRVDRPAVHEALGEIALAERRPRDAVAEFRRADVLPDGPANWCSACLPANLARAFDAAGDADSTIAAIEQYLRQPPGTRMTVDDLYLAPFSKRLGELYEARGDVARALLHYREFVALWKGADPELQPTVAEVRRRVAVLDARAR